jgi:hypothetical protein
VRAGQRQIALDSTIPAKKLLRINDYSGFGVIILFEQARTRLSIFDIGRSGALFELSKIKVECDSNHIHGAVAATGAALTKPIRVEHKARLIGELHTGCVFPLVPRVKGGVIKEFPVSIRCKPKRPYLGLTGDGGSVAIAKIGDSVKP